MWSTSALLGLPEYSQSSPVRHNGQRNTPASRSMRLRSSRILRHLVVVVRLCAVAISSPTFSLCFLRVIVLLVYSRQVARSPRKELAGLSWTVLPWLCGCVSSGRLAVALTGGLWGLGLHWGCGLSVGLAGALYLITFACGAGDHSAI